MLTSQTHGKASATKRLRYTAVFRTEALRLASESRSTLAVADQGGTRHRAAYRLCEAAPACLAVAVSQDGGGPLVHHHAGRVIFWSQLA